MATSGATFYITGVQLEKGSTATSFDYRPYGTEFQLCQRYFLRYGGDSSAESVIPMGSGIGSTAGFFVFAMPAEMRVTPSVSFQNINFADGVNPTTAVTSITVEASVSSKRMVYMTVSASSGITAYRPYYLRAANTTGFLNYSSEL
jgi:hypothetical protein